MNPKMVRVWLLLVIVFLFVLFFHYNGPQLLTLDFLKSQISFFQSINDSAPYRVLVVFFAAYVLMATLSIPGATVLTLAAGALFGFWKGLIVTSFASTLGATGAFLIARFLFENLVRRKFAANLAIINEGVKKDGAFYLFGLRLFAGIPFFLVNVLMGLTEMKISTFAIVSQLGMLPGTALYIYAGTRLGEISSAKYIVSAKLILALAAIGVLPLVSRKGLPYFRKVFR